MSARMTEVRAKVPIRDGRYGMGISATAERESGWKMGVA